MSSIIKHDGQPKIERFERFVALSNGQYWKANFSSQDDGITNGQLLMIRQIDDVDNTPHTIHVRLHPSAVQKYKTICTFLIDDFLSKFEHVESDVADSVRDGEVKAIQQMIKDSQDEMGSTYSDPALMDKLIEKELPKKQVEGVTALPIKHEALGADIVGAVRSRNLANLMSTGLSQNGVEQIRSSLEEQKNIAVRRSDWIIMRTNRLTAMASQMTPFFEEKAALQLALTKDVRDHIDELMKGIASLNLYTLSNVEVIEVKKGIAAPDLMPLTITQRVLYMDEELSVWEELDELFDYRDKHQFFEALGKYDGLVNQIFPNERSVVSIATSRGFKDYQSQGYTAIEVSNKNLANLCQYLLVRNGDNINVVLSPEVFHQYSETLFPTTWETEGAFKGWDGKTITYNDLEYTTSLSKHERIALGYKRLLILLCGLDHNKNLFGDFYDGQPTMDFVSLAFQEKHFNFIHDMDGEGLISTHRPTGFSEWLDQQNETITSGSTVLMKWRSTFDRATINAAFDRLSYGSSSYDSASLRYDPTNTFGDNDQYYVGKVQRKGNKLIMKIEVNGQTYDYKDRTFNATFDVSQMLGERFDFRYIAIDGICLEDALWYIHDRPSRTLGVNGIRLLRQATKLASIQKAHEQPIKALMVKDVVEGKVADEETASRLVDKALSTWRCAKPNKDVLSLISNRDEYNRVLNQIFTLNDTSRDFTQEVKALLAGQGRCLIRLVILANGDFCSYASVLENERDDRLIKFDWMHRSVIKKTNDGLEFLSSSFKHMVKSNPSEVLVYESDAVSFVSSHTPAFSSPDVKAKRLRRGAGGIKELTDLVAMRGDKKAVTTLIEQYKTKRHNFTYVENESSQFVSEPETIIVIGSGYKRSDSKQLSLAYKCETYYLLMWLCADDEALYDNFADVYISIFKNTSRDVDLRKTREKLINQPIYQIMSLSLINDIDSTRLITSPIRAYSFLRHKAGFSYSESLRIEDELIYIPDAQNTSLDELLGIKKPDDHFPCYVIKEKDTQADEFTMDVFLYDGSKYVHTVYDSLKEVMDANLERHSTTGDNTKSYDVVERLEKREPRTVSGIKTVMSFAYVTVSKKLRSKGIFDS
jgi:hypothetical protein